MAQKYLHIKELHNKNRKDSWYLEQYLEQYHHKDRELLQPHLLDWMAPYLLHNNLAMGIKLVQASSTTVAT